MRRVLACFLCLSCLACAASARAPESIAVAPSASVAAAPPPAASAPETIALGPVTLDLSIARTAQVFYFVDQLSIWSPHAHRQYVRWADEQHLVGDRERALLETHKRLRLANGSWGPFDRAFASRLSIADAATRAAADGLVSAKDADDERAILEAFQPLLARTLDEGQPRLEAFRDRLKERAPTIGRVLGDVQAMMETYTPTPIPLFIVYDPVPHTGGGGYNGGVAWVEVSDTDSAMSTLMHEAIHVVMRDREPQIAAGAASCGNGLDAETLNEGFDYAISPGIIHDENRDPLAASLDDARKRGKPATDLYVRYQRLGLAIRPLLESTLSTKAKLASLLPKACDAWRQLSSEPWP